MTPGQPEPTHCEKVKDIRGAQAGRAPGCDLPERQTVSRIKAIYEERASLKLDPESLRLVEYEYQQFVQAGANLSDADKAKLKKLNEEESTLENSVHDQAAGGDEGGRVFDDG